MTSLKAKYKPFVLLLSLLVTACGSNDSNPLHLSGLVFCSGGAPRNFNPHIGTSSTHFNASSRVIYNRLVNTDEQSGRIMPSLALSWERLNDGLTYRFQLQRDVAFHSTAWFNPTRELNSEDIVFSFKRQSDPDNPFHKSVAGEYNYYSSTGFKENLLDVVALEEDVVEFRLQKPDNAFLYSLSMDFASILSKEYAERILRSDKAVSDLDYYPVGTGPFALNKFQNNTIIRYLAHDKYMLGSPKISHLVYAITPDASTRYARLVSGECDVMLDPPKSQYELIVNNSELVISQKSGLNTGYMTFNTAKAPLDNVVVRRALSMAIDRQRIVEAVYGELGTENNSLLPPAMTPFHNPQVLTPAYDPETAMDLLSKAGVNNLELSLWALPVQRSYNPNGQLMAELIQEDLNKIGVKTKIVTFEWNTFLNKVKAGEHDLALLGWVADNYNAADFLTGLIGCEGILNQTNRSAWCRRDLDELILEAELADDEETMISKYYQAQDIIAAELPVLPIATGQSTLVAAKEVKNIEVKTLGNLSFSEVSKEAKK